jgi:hypothetical protein
MNMQPNFDSRGPQLQQPSYPAPAPQPPVVLEGKATRLFVTDAYLGWQLGTSPQSPQQGVGIHELLSLRLLPRLSWRQAALWFVFAGLVGFGGTMQSFLVALVLCTLAAVANLFLRRRYFLAFVLRDGRQFEVFVGDGYPPSPVTLAPSKWVQPFMQGWAWLAADLQRRGIAATTA